MRAIESKDVAEKRQNRNKLIAGIVLISIMILSSAGYAFFNYTSSNINADTNTNVNGLNFDGQYWNFNYNGVLLRFMHSQDQVNNISIDSSVVVNPSTYATGTVYVDSGNDTYIYGLIFNNLYPSAARIQQACYGKCDENLPEKDCSQNMIVYRKSETNKVWQQDKCVFIEGDTSALDAFFYKIYNILS